jgi:molybdopterin-binding protein
MVTKSSANKKSRRISGRTSAGRIVMKYGARNQLEAEVVEIKNGAVMCLVKVQVLAPAPMSSVMTLESLDELGLKKGDRVKVLAKAVNVLLAKE